MSFGVHEAASKAFSKNGGESWLRFNSFGLAKALVRGNIECLRLMSTDKHKNYLAAMRAEAIAYYLKLAATPPTAKKSKKASKPQSGGNHE